jgi:hypothetical protein
LVLSDYSYSSAPGADDLVGLVRLLVGDRRATSTVPPLFTDGEIAGVLSLQPQPSRAAAVLARAAAAEFSSAVNVTTGQTRVENAGKAKAYLALAAELESNAGSLPIPASETALAAVGPRVGGISWAAEASHAADTDRILASFRLRQTDMRQALYPVTRSEVE